MKPIVDNISVKIAAYDSLNDMINNGNTNEKTSSIESAVEIGDDSDISFASIESIMDDEGNIDPDLNC